MLAECKHRALIVDDDSELHSGIRYCFGDEFPITSAFSGEQAVQLARSQPFPVVILDLQMGGISGLETMELLRASWPYHKFIILTGNSTEANAIAALNKGAFRYFLKPISFVELKSAVASAFAQYEREMSLEAGRFSSTLELKKFGLTDREAEVAIGILENKTNAEIARHLGISIRTAEKHCERVLAKTGVSSRAKLEEELRYLHREMLERRSK